MGQSLRINWTIGYCLYVEERVQLSNTYTRVEYLSNSLFTFGESNYQHTTMQVLFTNTVDLQNENSAVER